MHLLERDGISIQIIKKRIKNIYFRIDRKSATLRISVPYGIRDKDVMISIDSKWEWVKKTLQVVQSCMIKKKEFTHEEIHNFLGKEYKLNLITSDDYKGVSIKHDKNVIEMYAGNDTTSESRRYLLYDCYKQEMALILPDIIMKYEEKSGLRVKKYGIKYMKTRWGSCNPLCRRIWINVELMKYPLQCLEYVVIHEICHFWERYHNDNFKRYLNEMMPEWKKWHTFLNKHFIV